MPAPLTVIPLHPEYQWDLVRMADDFAHNCHGCPYNDVSPDPDRDMRSTRECTLLANHDAGVGGAMPDYCDLYSRAERTFQLDLELDLTEELQYQEVPE